MNRKLGFAAHRNGINRKLGFAAHKLNYEADNACDSIGRLMDQSGNGLASRMTMDRNAAGVMADSPALIPLVGNNSRSNILFTTKTLIYRLQ